MIVLHASWKRLLAACVLLVGLGPAPAAGPAGQPASAAKAVRPEPLQANPPPGPLNVTPRHVPADRSVRYDSDIVYVRAPRVVRGKDGKDHQAMVWPNAGEPTNLRAPTDLILLHPDGREEVLVAGGKGAIAAPYVSFDAQWVYYSCFHDITGRGGADVCKVHVNSDIPAIRILRPILQRSCVACHSGKSARPAGNLVLDADFFPLQRRPGQRTIRAAGPNGGGTLATCRPGASSKRAPTLCPVARSQSESRKSPATAPLPSGPGGFSCADGSPPCWPSSSSFCWELPPGRSSGRPRTLA